MYTVLVNSLTNEGVVMISIEIKPSEPVDLEAGEYLGAVIDNVLPNGHVEVLVDELDIVADYLMRTNTDWHEAEGEVFSSYTKEVIKITMCKWLGHTIQNQEEVVHDIENYINL